MKDTSHGGGGDECQSSLSSSSYSSLSNKKKKQTFVVDDNDELSISQVISPCLSSNISPLLQPSAAVSSSSAAASSSSPLFAHEVSVRTRTLQKETLLPKQHQPLTTFESKNTSTILSSNNEQSSLSLFASSLLFGSTTNNDELEDVMLSSHHNTANCNDDDDNINTIDNDSENLTTSLSSNTSAVGGDKIDKSTTQHKNGKMALFYRSILLGQSSTPSKDRSCLISICILLLVTILVAGPTIIVVRTNSRSVIVETTTTTTTPTTTTNNPIRWYDTGNCLPNYRLANSTISIYCNGLLDIETIQYYCQGLSMEPNHCTMPSSGYWSRSIIDDDDDDSNTKAMTQQNTPYKFGLHDHHIDTDSSITTTPQRNCRTMEDVINGGAYTGHEMYNQEWTPQSCSLIPLSPFEWTRDTQCQTTIIMMVRR